VKVHREEQSVYGTKAERYMVSTKADEYVNSEVDEVVSICHVRRGLLEWGIPLMPDFIRNPTSIDTICR